MQTNTKRQSGVKAVGIKQIELDGFEDVYNMEVEGNHNFAVNGGLIVHNCADAIRYFVKTMQIARVPSAAYYSAVERRFV